MQAVRLCKPVPEFVPIHNLRLPQTRWLTYHFAPDIHPEHPLCLHMQADSLFNLLDK